MAQNIALGWLAGAREFELKTVQVLDELDLEKPCIEAGWAAFNTEWSQELRLDQSLDQYLSAWTLLHVLKEWEPLKSAEGFRFELSVGYDLAGICSPGMEAFLAAMADAGGRISDLRAEIPEEFSRLRGVPIPSRVVDGATLSTHHGTDPGEIEGIVRKLVAGFGLSVTLKLSPTLLGLDRVRELTAGRWRLDPEKFRGDLQWGRALEIIDRLDRFARERGRTFGIKLTNTLEVFNRTRTLKGEKVYLSGAPLQVLAVALLKDLDGALPGRLRIHPCSGDPSRIPVAFSAGVDKDNAALVAALGVRPVTVCTDLLRPGGYRRLGAMASALLSEREGLSPGEYLALLLEKGEAPQAPKAKRGELTRWDCASCGNCVTVCPNNAFLRVEPPAGKRRSQFVRFPGLCNACGNCAVWCPMIGDPSRVKPSASDPDARPLLEASGFPHG
jgi:putative selenate reductase